MSTKNTAPLYVQFAAAIRAMIEELGLPTPTLDPSTETGFPQNNGYFFVEWGAHLVAPALIVPKSVTRMGNLHSHIDLSDAEGHIPLAKRNGRVVCHFAPDLSLVSQVIGRFVGASKRPVAPPVKRLVSASQPTQPTQSTPTPASKRTVRIGSAADFELPAGDLEAASWATPTYTEEDAEEAIQALALRS